MPVKPWHRHARVGARQGESGTHWLEQAQKSEWALATAPIAPACLLPVTANSTPTLHKVPNLTADGTDTQAKAAAKPLGLSVRGTGGEHTPIGADGTIDLSPSNRLFITEAEIITKLYNGIKLLLELEAAAGAPAAAAEEAA